ncbi:MAG: hypothetical protein ACHQIM_16665 [Sphingobacteriales bacterium]
MAAKPLPATSQAAAPLPWEGILKKAAAPCDSLPPMGGAGRGLAAMLHHHAMYQTARFTRFPSDYEELNPFSSS